MSSQLFSTSRRRVLTFCFAMLACALAAFASPTTPHAKPQASGKMQAPAASAPSPSPTPTVTFSTVYAFSAPSDSPPYGNTDGVNPSALINDGVLYGTAFSGGNNGTGTVFEFIPSDDNFLGSLYSFSALPTSTPAENPDGANPASALVAVGDGTYLGTTANGGANASGTVFRIDQNGNLTTIHTFSALAYASDVGEGSYVNDDGADPEAALVSDGNGNFYGTTASGGTEGLGTIFKITPSGGFAVEHCFSFAEGGNSYAALVLRPKGTFLGTTSYYGSVGYGCVFEFDPSCECLSVLHAFSALSEGSVGSVNDDGAYAYAALTPNDPNNPTAYYGVASEGGNGGSGTIYSITFDPNTDEPTFTTEYAFSTPEFSENTDLYVNADGVSPEAPLILGYDGFFYGTAKDGGTNGYGTVFQFMPGNGNFFTLHNFAPASDGGNPETSLVSADTTLFYGTTSQLDLGIPPLGSIHAHDRRAARKVPAAMQPNATTSTGNGTIYLLDVLPAAGLIRFNPDTYTVDENAGTVKLTVTRTGGKSGAVSVNYTTFDGMAVAGTDYTSENGTLTWTDGNTASKTITIPILDRHLSSGSLVFYVEIYGPTGGALIDGGFSADYLYAYVTINDNDPATKPVITSATTDTAQVGVPYEYIITADNQPAGFDATNLPPGLTVDVEEGEISGTPTTAGTYKIALSATNGGGTGKATLTLKVLPATPVITSDTTASGQAGVPFTYQITASGSPTSYHATGLPNGLSLDTTTGIISGTPVTAKVFNVGLSAINAGGTGTATLTLTIIVAAPAITSPATATAQLGQAFSYTIKATGNSTSYAATGLPSGLSVNPDSGVIGGTPTAAGTFNVGLSATNAGGTGTKTLTLTVNPATPVITSALSAAAQVGKPFTYQITATGSPASYAATGLPAGLSVNATGLISGTPTATGTFNVELSATNAGGTGTAPLTLTVNPSTPVITSLMTASGQIGQAFSYQITASGNPTSYGATGLPAGLSVNATGLISGTPTMAGTFGVGLSATNAGGTGTATLTLTIASGTPVITSVLSAGAQVGQAFSYQIVATNNPTSYGATGLPAGLSVNATGLISGTPTATGKFNIGLSATNAGGTGTATLVLTVSTAAPTITSAATASGQVGKAFTYQITASGNPTSYAATGLPAGLSVNATGLISGTPTAAGTYGVGLSATNAGGTGTATLTINITSATPVISSATTASVQEGTSFTYQIVASGNPTGYAATGLPPGLNINPFSGIIAGTPTAAGVFTVGLSATNSGGTGTATLTLTVTASAPVITSALAADAQLNQPFTYQIAATNSPASYNAVNLPAGLTVDTTGGVISGTPTVAGNFNVGLSATNASGSGTATLKLRVTRAVVTPPDVTSATTANGQVGTAFTYQIVADNDPTSYGAHGLPGGLALDPATGLISGTPTSAGTFTVQLSATNAGGTGAATLTLTILPAAPVITSALTATGVVGQSFVYQIRASHKPTSFAASGLPAGLTVDTTTGRVTGTPMAAGTFSVGLSATNAGGTGTASLALTITINAPVITSAHSASAQVGVAFSYQITAANSPTSYAATNLPSNLSIIPSTGLISGTPTTVGDYSIGLSATNAGGTGTSTLTLHVVAAAPAITSPTTARGQVGVAFTFQIVATNNPTSYAVAGLPGGLVVDKTTGAITGTPITPGTFTVDLEARNSGGTGTATLTLTILPAAPDITSAQAANAHVGRSFAYRITASRAPTFFNLRGLPFGLTIDGATGLISGTPTVSGTFTVTLLATNTGGTGTGTLTLTVFPAAPAITSGLTANGVVGQTFTYRITATPKPTAYNASGLPPGLGIDPATGIVSGTLKVTGIFSIRLIATNTGGTGAATLTLTVTAPATVKPTITSPGTANGKLGAAFTYQIAASNNPTSYGTSPLPAGLSVDGTTGLISGTPTQKGTFAITIAAANAGGTGTASLVLTIADTVQPTIAVVSPPNDITVVVGSKVPFAASLADPDDVLAQVTFLVNNAVIGSVGAMGPYHVTYVPPAAGTYVLTAVATDTEGRTSSGSVTITAVAGEAANPAPNAGLLTPVNGENLAAGSTLTLSAMATTDSPAGLDHVSIIVDGAVIATFDANGNPITSGASGQSVRRQDAGSGSGTVVQTSYTLPGFDKLLSMIVAATDKLGQTSMSTVATFHSTVTTDRAPVVAFSNLAAILQVAVGAPQQAVVSASDPDATAAPSAASGQPTRQDASSDAIIAELTYFLNGVNIGSSSQPPYTFNFSAPAPGKYILHAVATDGAGLSSVSTPITVEATLPVVTIATGGDGEAVEGGEKGKVVITRTGDTSAPLTVFYKVKGSGVAGVDYQTLPGSVTIPAGSSKAKVKIKPIDDTTHEGVRKAKIKLLPSAGGTYTVGDTFLAKVTIVDND